MDQATLLRLRRQDRVDLDRLRSGPAAGTERIGGLDFKLSLPRRDLIGVNVELLGQLGYRPITLDGGKRHLCLEGRCVVPACSSAHGRS